MKSISSSKDTKKIMEIKENSLQVLVLKKNLKVAQMVKKLKMMKLSETVHPQ